MVPDAEVDAAIRRRFDAILEKEGSWLSAPDSGITPDTQNATQGDPSNGPVKKSRKLHIGLLVIATGALLATMYMISCQAAPTKPNLKSFARRKRRNPHLDPAPVDANLLNDSADLSDAEDACYDSDIEDPKFQRLVLPQ